MMEHLRVQMSTEDTGPIFTAHPKHAAVERFVTPEQFEAYAAWGKEKGFLMMASSPLTRSSYHADADFAALKRERHKRLVQTSAQDA